MPKRRPQHKHNSICITNPVLAQSVVATTLNKETGMSKTGPAGQGDDDCDRLSIERGTKFPMLARRTHRIEEREMGKGFSLNSNGVRRGAKEKGKYGARKSKGNKKAGR